MENKPNYNQPIDEIPCENPATACDECPYNKTIREQAMEWWNAMNLEEKFYKTIKYNFLLVGDKTRHPKTLTGREIKRLYKQEILFK